jgi:hypothetical protein
VAHGESLEPCPRPFGGARARGSGCSTPSAVDEGRERLLVRLGARMTVWSGRSRSSWTRMFKSAIAGVVLLGLTYAVYRSLGSDAE